MADGGPDPLSPADAPPSHSGVDAVGSDAGPNRALDLAIADLSPIERLGFRGPQVVQWLNELGFAVEPSATQAYRHPDHHLVVTVGEGELLVLPPLDPVARAIWDTASLPVDERMCRPTPRRDGSLWFRVTGRRAPQVIAALAGIDAAPALFPDLAVTPIEVMRHRGLLVRDDLGGVLAYHILFIRASASFLWTVVSNRIADMGGAAVNPEMLRGLAAG
ncbi:MAG: hypothetical protein KDA49_13995 [Rhodospirillaceae bacterium]|nr:hypothetical protein [Rhodospirillaceae bacterium]